MGPKLGNGPHIGVGDRGFAAEMTDGRTGEDGTAGISAGNGMWPKIGESSSSCVP